MATKKKPVPKSMQRTWKSRCTNYTVRGEKKRRTRLMFCVWRFACCFFLCVCLNGFSLLLYSSFTRHKNRMCTFCRRRWPAAAKQHTENESSRNKKNSRSQSHRSRWDNSRSLNASATRPCERVCVCACARRLSDMKCESVISIGMMVGRFTPWTHHAHPTSVHHAVFC